MKSPSYCLVLAGLILAMTASTSLANSILIDFEEFGIAPGGHDEGANRVSHGYFIESDHNHLFNDVSTVTPWNGSTWLGIAGQLKLSRLDKGAFSLFSLDAGEFYSDAFPTPPAQVLVTGNQLGGGTLTQVFSVDGIEDRGGPLDDFQPVTFGASWTNLQSVIFEPVSVVPPAIWFSLDNIRTTAVPEPSTLTLLAGAGALALRRQLRRPRRRHLQARRCRSL
ncbi:MAG: PEP-CTERM sorting domain-containing protein [Pirellulales bacterium]